MRSSMQKDVEHGNVPELDAIAGPILRGAQRHGIDADATRSWRLAVETKHLAVASDKNRSRPRCTCVFRNLRVLWLLILSPCKGL